MEQQKFNLQEVPLSDIFLDSAFNCRGEINYAGVATLANDIRAVGLTNPITIQPYTDVEGFKYRIIAGHRRFTAFQMNKAETIPSFIREDLTDMLAATRVNVQENLQRVDLNLMEEGMIVGKYIGMELNRQEIADELDMSPAWVQSRTQMFNLPLEVQQEIIINKITITDVKDIYTMYRNGTLDQMYSLVRAIKDGKKNPQKSVKKPKSKDSKRIRTRSEMSEMMDHIRDNGCGPCILTYLLAWASGNTDNGTIDRQLIEWHDEEGFDYESQFDDGSGNYKSK